MSGIIFGVAYADLGEKNERQAGYEIVIELAVLDMPRIFDAMHVPPIILPTTKPRQGDSVVRDENQFPAVYAH
jgi:hypothetical protein